MAWQGGLFEGHSLELLGQWAVGSGSETPWPEKTCHSCRAMTPWLGHGALISKQLSRGSQKQRPSGTSPDPGSATAGGVDSEVGSQSLRSSAVSKPRCAVSSGFPRTPL